MNWTDKIQVYNEDCMETMARYEDNFFDLAIVDPPYAWGNDFFALTATPKKRKNKRKQKHKNKSWNEMPNEDYFNQLFRVSKNQIICGGNYFKLPISRGWIFWDKGYENTKNFSAGELIWTSFNKILKKIYITNRILPHQNHLNIHPTQKPIKLYNWILENYAKPNDIILDTHLGSGSNAIACHYYGCSLVAAELDKEYYEASQKRFKQQTAQIKLF